MRQKKLPAKFDHCEINLAYAPNTEDDPQTYEKAYEQGKEWKDATCKKIQSL